MKPGQRPVHRGQAPHQSREQLGASSSGMLLPLSPQVMAVKQVAWKDGGGGPVGAGSGRNRSGIQRIEGKLFATIKKGQQSFHQAVLPASPSGMEAQQKARKAAITVAPTLRRAAITWRTRYTRCCSTELT